MTDETGTPQFNLEAEQVVLGCLMLSDQAFTDVEPLLGKGDGFYRQQHAVIYRALLELRDRQDPTDPITVGAHLLGTGELNRVGGAPYLHECMSLAPTAAQAGHFAKIVASTAALRFLEREARRIIRAVQSAHYDDADSLLEQARGWLSELTVTSAKHSDAIWQEAAGRAFDEIGEIADSPDGPVGIPTGLHDVDEVLEGLRPGQLTLVAARPRVGKALALDTPLPTPTGWTTMGAVNAGDELIGADGKPTRVVAATDVMRDRPCYEVEFSDGTVIVADAQHEWLTETRKSRKSASESRGAWSRTKNQKTFATAKTTEEIAATVRCETSDRRVNHSVANAKPVELPRLDLPLSPYALGVWLGDGSSWHANFTTADPEIITNLEADGYRVVSVSGKYQYGLRLPLEVETLSRTCVVCGDTFIPKLPRSSVKTCGRSCGGRGRLASVSMPEATCSSCGKPNSGAKFCRSCRNRSGSVQGILKSLDVFRNKHIPQAYLRASEQQRRDLLAGLLDTDGTVTSRGGVQFTTTSERLARGCADLIASLGYRVSIATKRVKGRYEHSSICYMVNFTTADKVFRLTRKVARQKTSISRGTLSRYIVDVRPIPSVPVRCVQVDNGDHMYLASRAYIPTHNSVLLLNIAQYAAMRLGKRVALFSLEMSESEVSTRMFSSGTGVPLTKIRTAKSLEDEDWAKLAKYVGDTSDTPLHIDASPHSSLAHIRATAKRIREEHGELDLVIVDYLQLMPPPNPRASRQEQVGELSRGLKLLAKELEVPVIAACQLNRGPEQRADKKPQLGDLRESGSLEQDADQVILLHREDADNPESPKAGECNVIIAKNRHGRQDTLIVAAQLHRSRFVSTAIL